jgi:L-cystine transport system ATP-binding protein
MLELKGIHKSFGKTEVLKGVDVSVEEGDIVGIIGSSGSGKSTLLRCINFLEHADAGTMELDGVSFDVKSPGKKNIRYMRQNTAMVFQQFNLFSEKNAVENVTLGLVKVQKKPLSEAIEIANQLLDKVGLSDRKDFFPSQLSGGQQQRVALARAIALNPKVILLDEPTSALDPEMINEVLEVIRQLAREKRTMIIVSHEMNFIYQICNKVLFMDNGVILESGTPEELFDHTREERTRQFLSKVSITHGK